MTFSLSPPSPLSSTHTHKTHTTYIYLFIYQLFVPTHFAFGGEKNHHGNIRISVSTGRGKHSINTSFSEDNQDPAVPARVKRHLIGFLQTQVIPSTSGGIMFHALLSSSSQPNTLTPTNNCGRSSVWIRDTDGSRSHDSCSPYIRRACLFLSTVCAWPPPAGIIHCFLPADR